MTKGKINNCENEDFRNLVLKYTGLFLIFIIFILVIFAKYNKDFIWKDDGLMQHIINLRYYRSLIINFFKTGSLSTFTWKIGMGFDLLGNLAYYILGDFFSLFAIFFPTNQIEHLYGVLIFVRLYFVGLSFLVFCRYKKLNNLSSLIGALMYAFCFYSLYANFRHPYFANPMILFPLLLIGIEKIILKDEIKFYTIIIFLTYLINFYFAYMLSVVIALYGIILAIYHYRYDGIKKIILVLGKTLLYSLVGITLAAIILLPTAMAFLNSERGGSTTVYPYVFSYYRNFVSKLLTMNTTGYWVNLGCSSFILISLPVFIRHRKQNYPLFINLCCLMIPLLISQVASVFCGFKYPNNRWCFVIPFYFSYITSLFLNKDTKLKKQDLIAMALFIIFYLLINSFFEIGLTYYTQGQIFIALVLLIVYLNKEKLSKKFSFFLTVIFAIGIMSSIYCLFEVKNGIFYVSEFYDKNSLKTMLDTSKNTIPDFDKALKFLKAKDIGFYKISKYPYEFENVSMLKNFNSIGHYYSLTNQNIGNLGIDLNNVDYYLSHGLKEFNYRTKITTLLGVKYLINANKMKPIFYGYEKLDYNGTSSIYQNKYALPFGVLYTDYVDMADYEKLSSLEKESGLLKTVALDGKPKTINLTKTNLEFSKIKTVDYEIIDQNKIVNDNNITITNSQKNSFKIKIGDIKNNELYISFQNLTKDAFSKEEMIDLNLKKNSSLIDQEKVKNQYKWYQENYGYNLNVNFNNLTQSRVIQDYKTSPYYMDVKDFMFNLGYYDETKGEITVSLSKIGNYTFDDIKVYAVNFDDYKNDIEKLRESNFEVIEYSDGYLKGSTKINTDGILQFQTLYNKGWNVYVDGKKVETLISNKYFLGIELPKGTHEIILKYHNPYIKIGFLISLGGLISFVILLIYRRRKNLSI